MSTLAIILTILGYVAMLFVVAWRSSRRADNSTFFTGGRSTHRAVAAVAMVGAAMSGVTYISVPGTVLADNFSYLQTCLGFIVGYAVIAYVLVPLYYKLGVVSLYEYLDRRFGIVAHRTGAWFFFVAKTLSAALRAYVICVVLQTILFDHYHIPFIVNAAIMMSLVWLYTRKGGVKSVVWVEMLKTVIMVGSLATAIFILVRTMGLDGMGTVRYIAESDLSHVLFFDDPMQKTYFWKQFFAGIFLVVAMTGLDQDMMQTVLSCRNRRDAERSMMTSVFIQVGVIVMFLALGVLLYGFAESRSIDVAGDSLFGYVATEAGLPVVMGVLFLLGLVASTYSSAGSALTALTTSFTLDIMGSGRADDVVLERRRKRVHTAIALVMLGVIVVFNTFSSSGVITLIFTMASYTYGPLLGLFAFGILTRSSVRSGAIPAIAVASPTICYILSSNSAEWLCGYQFSYELIILNGAITMLGLCVFSRRG
ncbi:MAG: sodium:solute symporter [Alistipes sp.]|nr:sodium:solute symporter [Alistipes sp.]